MKRIKLTLLLLLLISVVSFGQQYRFGWITDIHIGAPKAEEDLRAVVQNINKRGDISFVIATGDIAEQGKDEQLTSAKNILDSLKVKYYIIPGNHDTKWSPSGCLKFKELWRDDKISFEFNGTRFIGLNSAITWRGGGGHFSVEDIKWLESELSESGGKEVIFLSHHPLNSETDNWFKVTNVLAEYNTAAALCGHGHSNRLLNFNGLPGAMGRSTLSGKGLWGYTVVENNRDSIAFFEAAGDTILRFWGSIKKNTPKTVEKVDSLQFINYDCEILFSKDLQSTIYAPISYSKDRIFITEQSGIITCLDMLGNTGWQYDAFGTVLSRPALSDNVLVVATIQGDIHSINAMTGESLLLFGAGETITSQLIVIDYTGTKLLMNRTKPEKVVIAGTADGKLACYDLNTFELIWKNNITGGMIEAKPLYIDNKLIFGSWDGHLYCADARSGALIWKWSENTNFYYSPASCSPVTDGKYVFVSTPDKYVSAIDLLTGKTIWRQNKYQSWESIAINEAKDQLIVKGYTDKLFLLSPENGKLIKEIDMKTGLDTSPAVPAEHNGNIVIGSKNGMVYQLTPDFTFKPLFFTGTARLHSVQYCKDNTFAASNVDGKVFVFRIK